MVHIDIDYLGDLRCQAVHGPSKARLLTDAPLDNQGKGESFSPTDLLATALGTCMLTIMGIAAKKHGLDLTGARARVVKHMVADPTRRIGKLEVTIEVPGEHDQRTQALLRRAAETCPVHQSLNPRTEIALVLRFGAPARAG